MASPQDVVQALTGQQIPWPAPSMQPELVKALRGASSTYPSSEDAAKYGADAAYGTPFAAHLEPTSGMPQQTTKNVQEILDYAKANSDKPLPAVRQKMTDQTRNQIQQAYIASLHSPVSYLGFDPRMSTTTDTTKSNDLVSLGGIYDKPTNTRWWDQRSPTSLAHENIHAGLNKLRADNTLSEILKKHGWVDNPVNDEFLTRALMRKSFGDAEIIGAATKMGPIFDFVNDSNHKASLQIVKKYPGLLKDLEAEAQKRNEARQPKRGPA